MFGGRAKKYAPVPCLGRERIKTLRGATQIQAQRAPFAFCCGKGTAPVSGAAGDTVFAGSSRKLLAAKEALSVAGGSGYSCAVNAVRLILS